MTRVWHWLKIQRYLNDVIDLALTIGEPQVIDYGDHVAAVIISLEDYERLTGETVDLTAKSKQWAWDVIQEAKEAHNKNMPAQANDQRPAPGLYDGEVEIKPDFDDPLDEFDESEIDPKPDKPTE